jgi:hypothetical protein
MPAPPSFARFVAIDWSGARRPAAQRRAIVRCVVAAGARMASGHWPLPDASTLAEAVGGLPARALVVKAGRLTSGPGHARAVDGVAP